MQRADGAPDTGAGDPNDPRLDIPAITLKVKTCATLVLMGGTCLIRQER